MISLVHCTVELHNQDGELQDNMTVFFETEDTCFCYGHCGCAVSYLLSHSTCTCICLGCKKSWVRIPPEAAHFSLKKGRWVVSGAVALFVICIV